MSETHRIVIVQYLRGLAAFAVSWFHLTNTYGSGRVGASGSYGWLGVEVFFVISGFVIPYSLWNAPSPYRIGGFAKFLSRRLVRLEPPYLASIALVIALWYASAATPGFRGSYPSQDSYQVLFHLFYLVPLTRYEWLQPVYWSLAYEFVFYISVGFAYPILTDKKYNALWLFGSMGLAIAGLVGLLPEQFLLFVIGVSLFRNLAGLERPIMSVVIASAAAAAIAFSRNPAGPQIAMVGLLTAAAIRIGRDFEMKNVPGSVLSFLGTISYSLYLIHVPIGGRVVNLGRRLIEGQVEQLSLSLLALAISLGCAWAFYVAVERRSLQLSRQLFRSPGRSSKVAAE
jgi:peptidoglycan/LPS O-acetylase OafA/YrhL